MGTRGFTYALLLCIFLYGDEVNGYTPENNYVSFEEFSSFKAALDLSNSQFSKVVQNQQNQIDTLEKNQKEIIQHFEAKIMTLKHQHANEIKRLQNDIVRLKESTEPKRMKTNNRSTNTWTVHHQAPRSNHSAHESAKPQHIGDVYSEHDNVNKSSSSSNRYENKISIREATIKYKDRMFIKHIRNIGDNNSKVAFFARSNDQSDIAMDQIIPFIHVRTNVGNMYSAQTGVFHCGVPGTYVFSYTITCNVGHGMFTYLSRNGDKVLRLVSPSISNDFSSASGMAVLELDNGDSVMVKSLFAYNGAVIDDYSYFSGFLLYPK